MQNDEPHLRHLMEALSEGWRLGDGNRFAAAFTERAHFVAFDGTILNGPPEIARFHQEAFGRHLRATRLEIVVHEIRSVGRDAYLIFATGGVKRADGSHGPLMGDSVQTILCKREVGELRIEAFQNTRLRPLKGERDVEAWREFDRLWEHRDDPKPPKSVSR